MGKAERYTYGANPEIKTNVTSRGNLLPLGYEGEFWSGDNIGHNGVFVPLPNPEVNGYIMVVEKLVGGLYEVITKSSNFVYDDLLLVACKVQEILDEHNRPVETLPNPEGSHQTDEGSHQAKQ